MYTHTCLRYDYDREQSRTTQLQKVVLHDLVAPIVQFELTWISLSLCICMYIYIYIDTHVCLYICICIYIL